MRIAIGQLWQESNTLNPLPTTLQNFEAFGIYEGQNLVEQFAETNELGGFIQGLHTWPTPPEIVGLVRFAAWPSGPLDTRTFNVIIATMLDSLARKRPVDGILLALHGALVAECKPDVEGHFLQKLRQMTGPKIPIVATLDLHANITQRMVDAADALVLYHTTPHIDVLDTGRRGGSPSAKSSSNAPSPSRRFARFPWSCRPSGEYTRSDELQLPRARTAPRMGTQPLRPERGIGHGPALARYPRTRQRRCHHGRFRSLENLGRDPVRPPEQGTLGASA